MNSIVNYINENGYCAIELGTATGGDGPYYDGDLVLQIDLIDGVYVASEYIDCGDGPVEEPSEICSSTSLDELLKTLRKEGYECE